ncbi:MAG: Panacea domain-containing protein [Rhizomicrobium sp.]
MTDRLKDENTPAYLAPLVGYRSRKAAQICAKFANLNGGIIDKLKVIKLVYFAERQFLADHHLPMLFDEFYSLPHGPICSSTLNGLDGLLHKEVWNEFLQRDGRDKIVSMKKFERDELDEISDAELIAIEKVWGELGKYSAWEIRDYSHDKCPEYTLVTEGRLPISYREVLAAMGEEDAEAVEREISDFRRLEGAMG